MLLAREARRQAAPGRHPRRQVPCGAPALPARASPWTAVVPLRGSQVLVHGQARVHDVILEGWGGGAVLRCRGNGGCYRPGLAGCPRRHPLRPWGGGGEQCCGFEATEGAIVLGWQAVLVASAPCAGVHACRHSVTLLAPSHPSHTFTTAPLLHPTRLPAARNPSPASTAPACRAAR